MTLWKDAKEYKKFLKDLRSKPELLADMAHKYYESFFPGLPNIADQYDPLFKAMTKLIWATLNNLSDAEKALIKKELEFRGELIEPYLWEDNEIFSSSHLIVEDSIQKGKDTTLNELLLMGHDLEYIMRPSLLRINWLLRVSDGEKIGYVRSQINKRKESGSLGYALEQILDKLADIRKKHAVLSTAERRIIREFIQSLNPNKRHSINIGDMRNWIAHRDFFIGDKFVIFCFLPYPGKRIQIPKNRITEMRRMEIGLCMLMIVISDSFKVAIEAQTKGLRPYLRAKK